jgi:hypothetical protein
MLSLSLAGCQKADDNVVKKLDEISAKLDKLSDIEKKLDNVGARGPIARPTAMGPQPGRPDPSVAYAVPIDGAPFKGAKDAKVTIVEAFEFA